MLVRSGMSFTCLSHSLIVEASSRSSTTATLFNVNVFNSVMLMSSILFLYSVNDYAMLCPILAVGAAQRWSKQTNLGWNLERELSPQTHQSDGGVSIPQKFSGMSKSKPSSHEVLSMTEMASTIRPFLLRPLETSFTVTGVSFVSRSWRITPQP
jgi:hypothetical protein